MRVVNTTRVVSTLLALATVTVAVDRAPAATTGTRNAAVSHGVLPFIADDYTRAVAEARARKVPLFIEAWAPW